MNQNSRFHKIYINFLTTEDSTCLACAANASSLYKVETAKWEFKYFYLKINNRVLTIKLLKSWRFQCRYIYIYFFFFFFDRQHNWKFKNKTMQIFWLNHIKRISLLVIPHKKDLSIFYGRPGLHSAKFENKQASTAYTCSLKYRVCTKWQLQKGKPNNYICP